MIFRVKIFDTLDRFLACKILMHNVRVSEFTYTTDKNYTVTYVDLNFSDEKSFFEFKEEWDKFLKD